MCGSTIGTAPLEKAWTVKSAQCLDHDIWFAEEIGNPREWKYMSETEAKELGGFGTVIGKAAFDALSGVYTEAPMSALPDVVADPLDHGDMQAAIGAAHVEQHGDNEDDFNPDLDSESYDDDYLDLDDFMDGLETIGLSPIVLGGEPTSVADMSLADKEAILDRNVEAMRDVIFGNEGAYLLLTIGADGRGSIVGNMNALTAADMVSELFTRDSGL